MAAQHNSPSAGRLRSASLKACLNSPASDSTDEDDNDSDQEPTGQSRLHTGFSLPFIEKLASLWTGRSSQESEAFVPHMSLHVAYSCPSGAHLSEASCSCPVLGPLRIADPAALNLSPGAVARDRNGMLRTFPWQNPAGLRLASPGHQRAVENLAVRVAQRKQSMRNQHLVAARSMREDLFLQQEREQQQQQPALKSSSRGLPESFRLPPRFKAKLGTTQLRSMSAEPGSSLRRFSGLKRASTSLSPDMALPALKRWTHALLPKRARPSPGPPPQSARSMRTNVVSGKSARQLMPQQRKTVNAQQPAQSQRQLGKQQQQQPEQQRQPAQQPQQQRQPPQHHRQLRAPSTRVTYVRSQQSSQSNYLRPAVSSRSSLGQHASFQYTPSSPASTNWEPSTRPVARREDALDADERSVMMSRIARRASRTQSAEPLPSPFAKIPEHRQPSSALYYHTKAAPVPWQGNDSYAQPPPNAHAWQQQQHEQQQQQQQRQHPPKTWRAAHAGPQHPHAEPERVLPPHTPQQPIPYTRRHADALAAQQEYLAAPHKPISEQPIPSASRRRDLDVGSQSINPASVRASPIAEPSASFLPSQQPRVRAAEHRSFHQGRDEQSQPGDENLVANGVAADLPESHVSVPEIANVSEELPQAGHDPDSDLRHSPHATPAKLQSASHPMRLSRRRLDAALKEPPHPDANDTQPLSPVQARDPKPKPEIQPLPDAEGRQSAFSRRGPSASGPGRTAAWGSTHAPIASAPPQKGPAVSHNKSHLPQSEKALASSSIPGFSPPTPPLDFAEPRGLMQPDDSSEASQSPRMAAEEALSAAATPQPEPERRSAQRDVSSMQAGLSAAAPGPEQASRGNQRSMQKAGRDAEPARQQALRSRQASPPSVAPPAAARAGRHAGVRLAAAHAWPSSAARQERSLAARAQQPPAPMAVTSEAVELSAEDISALAWELQQLRSQPRHKMAPHEMTRYLELKLKLANQQQQEIAATNFVPSTPLQMQLMPSAAHRRGASPPRKGPSRAQYSNPLLSSPSEAPIRNAMVPSNFADGSVTGQPPPRQGRTWQSAAASVVSDDSHSNERAHGSVEGSLPSQEASIGPSPYARRGKGRVSHAKAPQPAQQPGNHLRQGFDAIEPLNPPAAREDTAVSLGTALLDEVACASDHSHSQGVHDRESSAELAAQQAQPSPYTRSFVPASARQKQAHRQHGIPVQQQGLRPGPHAEASRPVSTQRPTSAHSSMPRQHASRNSYLDSRLVSEEASMRPHMPAQPYQRQYQPHAGQASHRQATSVDSQPVRSTSMGQSSLHAAAPPSARTLGRAAGRAAPDEHAWGSRAAGEGTVPAQELHMHRQKGQTSRGAGPSTSRAAPAGAWQQARPSRAHENAWHTTQQIYASNLDSGRFTPVIDKEWSQLVKANKTAKRHGLQAVQPRAQQQHGQQKHTLLGTRSKAKND